MNELQASCKNVHTKRCDWTLKFESEKKKSAIIAN